MPTKTGIPQGFSLFLTFGLLIAGVLALVGFALYKDAGRLEALELSNEAAAESWDTGLFCIEEGHEDDPSLELLDRAPLTCAAAEPIPIEEIAEEAMQAAADPARGEELYFAKNCQTCHGDLGQGIVGPTIAQTGLAIQGALAQYRQPRGIMPVQPPEDTPPDHVADIWAWLQTLDLPEELLDPNGDALGHENIGQYAR